MPTLGALLMVRPPPAKVLSIGCSLGLLDALFIAHGYEVLSLDKDQEVLALAEALSSQYGLGLRLEQADAFDLAKYHRKFDVSFSAGLVEHWHGKETVRLLEEHARCARLVQVEVPTKWTSQVQSVEGVTQDMHPFRAAEFRRLVKQAGLRPVVTYPIGIAPFRFRGRVESLLPPFLLHRLKLWGGLSMGVGVIGSHL